MLMFLIGCAVGVLIGTFAMGLLMVSADREGRD